MLATASVARSLPFSAAARAPSAALALKLFISSLTFDFMSSVLPFNGMALTKVFGAALGFTVLAVFGAAFGFAALGAAALVVAFGFSVSAIKITPWG